MGRDKAKDDKLFNCSQPHEIDEVAGNFDDKKDDVAKFLQEACDNGRIKNMNHGQVYRLVAKERNLPEPPFVDKKYPES